MNYMSNKKQRSLDEINNTVDFNSNKSASQKFLAFLGPGLLVAVGYMDPGNWITSMQGGAQFGYILLFIILISSLAAMLLQSMTVRLGIATEMDLAQMTRHYLNRPLAIIFWIIAELAIIATDIAEIIGSAIALDLLFNYGCTYNCFRCFSFTLYYEIWLQKNRSDCRNINFYCSNYFLIRSIYFIT